MSITHDDQTQVLNAPPGKPRKKWHQRWSVRIPALALAGLIGIIAASGGGSHHLTVNSEGAWTIKVVTAP
jgi:hypothetical protein